MKRAPTVLLLVACAIVVLSSFLPWIQFRMQVPPGIDMQGMGEFMREALTATGWQGDVSLAGLTVPNWFVPILAIAIAAVTLMKGADVWDAPPALSIAFAGYCTAHLGFLIVVVVMVGSQARLGFGAPLGLLASISALGILIFARSGDDEPLRPERTHFQGHETSSRGPMQDDVSAPPDFSPKPRQRV